MHKPLFIKSSKGGVKLSNYPKDRKYHPEHTWAKLDGDIVLVGISYFAQDQLGEVLFVELPEVGDRAEEGTPFGVIESAKVTSDLISPVNGKITEINTELEDRPTLVNDDPYRQGWIVKIKVDNTSELDGLLDADGYADSVE